MALEALPNIWQSIPKERDAFAFHRTNPIDDDAFNALRDVLVRHEMHRHYGIIVKHRHMDLQSNERLVQYGNVVTPWQIDEMPDALRNQLTGSTWALTDGGLVPYEFAFDAQPSASPAAFTTDFVGDLALVMETYGLTERLGISRVEHEITGSLLKRFEYTMGRTTITMDQMPEDEDEAFIEVLWGFHEGRPGAVPQRTCSRCCRVHW
ncbi:hypothetical protein MBLNU230_g8441t1 [Neophaeotheca triangularis]